MTTSSSSSAKGIVPVACALALACATILTGCGMGNSAGLSADAQATATPSVGGKVFGGSTPVSGAHVYVMAAGNTSYYSSAIPGTGQSTSLLTANTAGSDSTGGYVLTNSTGGFSIPAGSYTCTAGQQVYILALGGNPGLGTGGSNPALALMSILGDCPAAGNFASSVPFVWINELSTVAAAYALSGFTNDPTHISSGSSAASKRQLKNAFATASNLFNTATGTALATTPAGNGVVPQATLNTLANILVSCVNTNGASSAPCSTLFSNSQNNALVTPTNTLQAIINIVHQPFNNVSNLYSLQNAQMAFTPALSSAPADFTLPITYTVGINGGSALAIDGTGSIWFGNSDNTRIAKLSNLGVPTIASQNLWASGGTFGFAIDSTNAVWAVNQTTNTITKLNSDGSTAVAPFTNTDAVSMAYGAVDSSDNYWQTVTAANQRLYEYSPSGVVQGTPFILPTTSVQGFAIDTSGQFWNASTVSATGTVTDTNGNNVATFSTNNASQMLALDNTNRAVYASAAVSYITAVNMMGTTPNTTTFSGGPGFPNWIAIDSSNFIWYPSNAGGLSAYTSGGQVVGPNAGFSTATTYATTAVDGSGNLWAAANGTNKLVEFVGLSVPTATPISALNHARLP